MYQEASGFGVGLDRDEKKTQPSDGIFIHIDTSGRVTSSVGFACFRGRQADGSRRSSSG
jgi:hypothetical protein